MRWSRFSRRHILPVNVTSNPIQVSSTTTATSIIFATQWDAKSAYAANAVHFCSRQCKDLYLARWREELVA